MARSRGLRPTAQILSQKVRAATIQEADQLRVAPGAEVLELIRLRGMERTAICLDTTVLPLDLARPLVDADLADGSLYEALQELCSVHVHRSAYSVSAEVADTEFAEQLGVEVGWPVLVGQEVGYDEAGHPVLVGITRYRGDSYRFHADLYRPMDRQPSD